MFKRYLSLTDLLKKKSFFLFGPRSTGKTTLVENQLPTALAFDLLDDEVFERLIRRPKIIEESITAPEQIVVIDEVQRIPKILNEVHRLIKSKRQTFLLTGSSARKLRRGGANLLGGRAWEAHLHPLCFAEFESFDLLKYLNRGGLPHVYLSQDPREELRNYSRLYLKEEVMAESLVRNLEHFIRFLDVIALSNGEELHYQGLSNDTGISAKTISNYVQILEDTLIGFQVLPFLASTNRKAITRSKFFIFDIGVTNALAHRGEILPKSELFGKAFEHLIARELRTYIDYNRKDLPLQFWRTTSHFEVDFVVGNKLAIEVKATDLVTEGHIKGLKALKEEGKVAKFCVVSLDPEPRVIDGIQIYPWKRFLESLWSGSLV